MRLDPMALGAGVLALLLWSVTTSANKIAVLEIDGITVGILRSVVASVIAVLIVTLMRIPPPRGRIEVALLMLSGVTSFAIWPALLSKGVGWTTAGHAGLVMALIPVLTVLFSQLPRRRVPARGWWAGAVLALGGTALLIMGR